MARARQLIFDASHSSLMEEGGAADAMQFLIPSQP